ncbi:hypothetical protein QC761_502890 [Podospora bellae-mahoneyi]|uniref:Uncharacterized protein n=1 Tax=Podospora bellae-mahoneyi TaxID=2093777 RepID=A0ABR0FCC4_9PEZI|nr:hypothetical protein QC761_502890 [Podospora bellae-mahoneyi]
MQRIDLLSAIRTLDVSIPSVGGEPLSVQPITHANKTRQWKFLRKPKTPSQDPGMDQMVKRYPIWPLAFGQYHPNPSCLSSTPLINSMPNLRDIHWHCRHVHSALPLPDTLSSLITNSKSPPINLHLTITTRDDRRPNPRLLQLLSQLLTYPLTPNLTSLKINITYYIPNYTRQVLHPLKAILCYAPNLQKLSLDIWYHRSASGPGTLDEKYFGFGFTSAEKLATKRLKHLTIHAYPFGRPAVAGESNWNTEGYPPNTSPEVDYWAREFYWGALETLQLLDVGWMGTDKILASVELAAKLGTLRDLKLDGLYGPGMRPSQVEGSANRGYVEGIWRFLRCLPQGRLEHISLPFVGGDVIPVEAVTWFGNTLTRLDITRSAVTEDDLWVLGRNLPRLRELRIWCERQHGQSDHGDGGEGRWPETTFGVLADAGNFPSLRDLHLTFELGFKEKQIQPPIGERIHGGRRSGHKSPSLQRVHLSAGELPKRRNDPSRFRGFLDAEERPKASAKNAMSFVCSPQLDTGGVKIKCPKLVNAGLSEEKIQRAWALVMKYQAGVHGNRKIQELEDKAVAILGIEGEKAAMGDKYWALVAALKGPQWGD